MSVADTLRSNMFNDNDFEPAVKLDRPYSSNMHISLCMRT